MPDEKKSSKTTDEWIALAKQGKMFWNILPLLADSDFINFGNGIVPTSISFDGFIFRNDVDFSGTKFGSTTSFSHAQFKGKAKFCATQFEGEVYFRNAEFNGDVYFDGAKFKNHVRFRDAKFKSGAYFRETEFGRFANFHGAEFARAADFKDAKFHMAPWFKKDVFPEDIFFNDANQFSEQFRDVEGEFAEANYRKLKLGMKSLEAHSEENAFFRLEMLARKHKEPWPRKGLYWLYELASDYGQSILLPAMWLGVFFLAFLWFYHLSPQFFGLGEGYDGYVNALQLALKGAFVLPGMFAGGSLEKIQLSGFGIVLAGVHWLLSAASWFLMLLGLRNRFRLK